MSDPSMLPVDTPTFHPNLPIELEEQIIGSLAPDGEWPDAPTLINCALVCRVWYDLAVKLLYSRVEIFGLRDYRILERTLLGNEALGPRVHTLSIHDITPDERASLAYLHSPQTSMHLQVKRLIISGPYGSQSATFPYQCSLLADFSQFKFLRHIHFYEIEFGSLDDLLRILGAIPELRTAIFQSISWRDRDVQFWPLTRVNATAWRLTQCSLSECSSNVVAPVFWAMPPIESTANPIEFGGDEYHPPLCMDDVVPLVELAKFILEHETSESRPTCWEWRRNEEELGDWFLECCFDHINTLENSTYIRSDVRPLVSQSTSHSRQISHRIVGIRISVANQDGFAMDHLDGLLCMFPQLESLHLNFLELRKDNSTEFILQQLPKLRNKMNPRGMPTSQRSRISLSDHGPTTCCISTKTERANARPFVLQTLYRLQNKLSTMNSIEGSVRAYEVILQAQRELVLIDEVLNMPGLLGTLDSLAYCGKEAGRADDAVDYASEALQICREFSKKDAETYTLQLTAGFERMLTYLLDAGRSEGWMELCREALNLWQKLVTRRSSEFERYAPRFIDSYNNILLSHPPYASYVYQHRAMVVWTKLIVRDVDRYGPSFASALCAIAHSPFSRDVRKESTCDRDGAVGVPQEPNLVQALEDAIESLPMRKCDDLTITHGHEIVEVCRVLATKDVDRYGLCFARSLDAYADSFDRWCQYQAESDEYKDSDKSSIYRRQAIAVLRKLAARDPDRYGPALVHALEQMIDVPSKKRGEDALGHRRDTVDVCREIAAVDMDRYGPCLARALRALADHLFSLNRLSESLTYRWEAANVMQKVNHQANTNTG